MATADPNPNYYRHQNNNHYYWHQQWTPNYSPPPYVKPNVCPGCGQCNTCGRPAPRPWTVTYGTTTSLASNIVTQ